MECRTGIPVAKGDTTRQKPDRRARVQCQQHSGRCTQTVGVADAGLGPDIRRLEPRVPTTVRTDHQIEVQSGPMPNDGQQTECQERQNT